MPLLLILLSAIGYDYSASALYLRLGETIALILCLILVKDLLLRWLFIVQRRLVFEEIETYGVAGPEWLKTKKGSVNLIFFGGQSAQGMQSAAYLDNLVRAMNQDKFPAEGLAFFQSHEPINLKTGIILTDDFSPLDLLQGEG